jgi:alanine racemase
LNFGTVGDQDADILVENNITQSVFSTHIHSLNQSGAILGKKAKVNIHIDSAMGRAGISYRDAMPFLEEVASLENIQITGTSITLPQDIEFDKEVVDRFVSLCQGAEAKGITLGVKHAASSNGIFASPTYYLDMIRPGILLYGYCDDEELQNENGDRFKPVLQLKSRVADVKNLLPGDTVSYGRLYKADQEESFALISIGYSDGYPVNAVNKGSVLINGERYPIIAKITANHLEVLLKPDSQVRPGDEVVLIGSQGNDFISAYDVANWGSVSIYQLLARLNPLLPRKVTP